MNITFPEETAPYGVKALRQIRDKRAPSERLSRKISQTYDYFLEKVDPVVGKCITYLLSEQPNDIPTAMIEFLQMEQENTPPTMKVNEPLCGKPRRELKVFLATSIAPVIAGLVNRIAVERPDDVMGFMTVELKKYQINPNYFSEMSLPKRASSRPSTAPSGHRSKHNHHGHNGHHGHKHTPGQNTHEHTHSHAPTKAEVPAVIEEKNIQLAMLGLGGAGKSSILNALQGKFDVKVKPTVGFRPVSMMLSEETKIRFYDLGGGKKIRDIWSQYYHDVHGVIYVIDGTTPQEEMDQCMQTFADTMNDSFLTGKPLLVLVNKQDDPNAASPYDFQDLLRPLLKSDTVSVEFAGCSCIVPEVAEGQEREADPRIEASLMHLLNNVLSDFTKLNHRVQQDSQRKNEEEMQKRIAKERKVLKNKIASAFIPLINPDYINAHNIKPDPNNLFSEEEGLDYLASEIGEEVGALSAVAREVASLVGYQKLALTIIGGLKSPVSKKKVPMEWQELLELVSDLRNELGLLQGPVQ